MSVKTVIAHHPYEAEREDEISFEKEEVIKVTDFSDPDWWVGKKKDGSLGFFPSNFVTVLQDGVPTEQPTRPEVKEEEEKSTDKEEPTEKEEEEEEKKEESVQEEEKKSPVEEKKVDKIIGMARVMEDYAMQEQGELSLHRGGIVNVYEVLDDEWSRGELNGKTGKYPHKYVEDIDMPGRPDLGMPSVDAHTSGEDDAPKGGFKLAAFGVKQGGIGSLLAGGFPGLKKTPSKEPAKSEPKSEPKPAEPPVIPVAAPSPVATTPAIAPVSPAPPTTSLTVSKAIVLHPYDAEGDDELSLLRGEYVDILDRHADEGWWKGRNERGLVGVFPVNFVRELEPESLAPPTPTRSRRSNNENPVRPTSVQSPVTTRPISVQAPAQRPSSISHTTTTHTVVSPRISEQVKEEEEETMEEEGTAGEEEEEQVVVVEKKLEPAAEPAAEAVEKPVAEVLEKPVEKPVEKPAEKPVEKPVARSIPEPTARSIPEPAVTEPEAAVTEPEKEPATEPVAVAQPPATPDRSTSFSSEDSAKPLTTAEEEVASPVVVTEEAVSDEEEKETPAVTDKEEEESETCEKKEEKTVAEEVEEAKEQFNDLPTEGPKLTTPSRARIGRARRSPQITSQEPSQTEILEKELQEQAVEEKKTTVPSPPAKPVKPIFAKFPTPFAVGGDALSKAHLKPTQTRRLWEEKSNEVPANNTVADEEPTVVRPSGVKNLASRFNFAGGNASGSNEVLETKLKNHTKNEIEKVRKEYDQLLNEEKEKRLALEQIVQELLERVKALEEQ